jgi:two-component system CheB/CheR fusion protein
VENHEDTVKYMRLYLEHLGHEVIVAGDMATALADFPRSNCEVLISDIGLPDGDGWQLMERMKSRRPTFAIAMSGYGTGEDLHRSRSAGYNRHLVKPFPPDELIAVLREASAVIDTQGENRSASSSCVESLIGAQSREGKSKSS